MPLYDYLCECGHKYEELKPFKDRNHSLCFLCHSEARLIPSTFAIISHNPFPVSGNVAGDGEGFKTKYMGKEEYKEHKQEIYNS
ncbi:hypothetical protein LCGC14_0430880 [marine sediment metagenome]|uniref:Putative regulatory protein FmdB zinc ribbon domain-containing protein n=1 Tax=marine sediment metagenome TaxID=412755 RepID=A0A0F9VXH2_9ZZZZ